MKVIKKDGTLEEFDGEKIVNAVNKSASRVMITLDDTAFHEIVGAVLEVIEEKGLIRSMWMNTWKFAISRPSRRKFMNGLCRR